MRSTDNNDLLTRQEAAARLKISVPNLDRLLARKSISHYKIGRRVYISNQHLAEFLLNAECQAEVPKRG
jgi:excisionase family DNA binding protein